jgi:hypothetical protein
LTILRYLLSASLENMLSPLSNTSAWNSMMLANTTFAGSNGTCELSPRGQYLSTVLTAFSGSIIGGISGGHFVAFYTAWICCMATLRIVLTGIWQVYEAAKFQPLEGGHQFHSFWSRVPVLRILMSNARTFDDPFFRDGARANEPTILGWASWLWATCYAPISQVLWLVAHWNTHNGGLKIVRAIGVSVTALPLTMDTKARYGAVLEQRFGRWSRIAFTFIHANSCMILGLISAIELIQGAVDAKIPAYVCIIYCLVMVFWTFIAFGFSTPHDEAYGSEGVSQLVAGLLMGAFGGLFTAAPAYSMMTQAETTPGVGISVYLRCKEVSIWKKVTAIIP